MNLGEALTSSIASLAAHKLRSALTVLGVVFGVGAVIAMLAIGAGAETEALEMIDRLGLHNVLVRAKSFKNEQLREIRETSPGLSLRDSEAIRDAVPGVEVVSAKVTVEPYTLIAGTNRAEAQVYGVEPAHAALAHLRLAEGRFLDDWDLRDHAQVCIIGPAVRRDLFGYRPALGAELKVNELWLTVVGVLEAGGAGGDSFQGVPVGSDAWAIYLPLTTAQRKLDRHPLDSPLSEIIVRLGQDAPSSRATAKAIDTLLDRLHGGADDYDLVVPEALLEQSRRTQRLFNIVMGCIAGISLVVGGIGIMNIMLATVLERTREIGVRRAVGARRQDILLQFIAESFTLSALGGVTGVLMGVVLARVIAASAGWPTLVTPLSVLLATGVAMTVGVASGLYPAKRAAELDPIDALRFE